MIDRSWCNNVADSALEPGTVLATRLGKFSWLPGEQGEISTKNQEVLTNTTNNILELIRKIRDMQDAKEKAIITKPETIQEIIRNYVEGKGNIGNKLPGVQFQK